MRHQDRVFLMDGDALIIPQRRLMWIVGQIRTHLPWVKRVGAYANTKGVRMKCTQELVRLRENGLGILYLGVETGDDEVHEAIRKGSSVGEAVDLSRRVKEAGIKLSVTVLLGIAGRERSLVHARATGEILSAMDPDYVGALTVMLIPGTPLFEDYRQGRFELSDHRGLLVELREMLAHTNLTSGLFFSNYAPNYLPVKARLPGGKEQALDLIDGALRGEIGLRPEWMRAL